MISTNQLLCVLLLSRLSAEIVFPQSGCFSGSTLTSLILSEIVCFLLALPVIIYSAKGRSFYAAIADKNRAIGLITGYGAAFIISFLATRTVLYTAEFAQRGLVTNMSGAVIAVLLAAFAVYSAVKGVEAISRAALLFAAAAIIITGVVLIADIPHIQLRQIGAVKLDEQLISLTLHRLMHCGEYLAFAALLPYVKAKEKGLSACSAILIYAALSLIGSALINLFSMSVLGEFYGIADFPFIAASGLADITLFKRLDGFSSAIWSACSALRCGTFAFSAYAMIKAVLKPNTAKPTTKGEPA